MVNESTNICIYSHILWYTQRVSNSFDDKIIINFIDLNAIQKQD